MARQPENDPASAHQGAGDISLDLHVGPPKEQSSPGNGGGGGGGGLNLDPKDMLALAAAATTLVSVVSGLAVTGALQQMQRNHGVLLISAFACVLLAAWLWALAAVWKWREDTVKPALISVAVLAFLGGLAVGIWGMVITQQAQERPTVMASLGDKNLLSATATAHNLGTEDRMYTELTALKPKGQPNAYEVVRLYFAISGPDAGGTATQQFVYTVPSDSTYAALAISATTGNDTGCFDKQPGRTVVVTDPKLVENAKKMAQRDQPGCVLIFQP